MSLFPIYYERYIEVFGGGGWVLFHKPPGNDFEVYNDFNGLLVNLYRCVREKPEELMEALRFVLNAREDFDAVRAALARDSPASDVQRAAWFYQLIRYSLLSQLIILSPRDFHNGYTASFCFIYRITVFCKYLCLPVLFFFYHQYPIFYCNTWYLRQGGICMTGAVKIRKSHRCLCR